MTTEVARRDEIAAIDADPVSDLLSSIAHELRAPLSSIAAAAEMFQTAELDDQRRFASIIERQALRLSGIVEGLLEAYGARSGQVRRLHDAVDVTALLAVLCDEQRILYPRHRFEAAPGETHLAVCDERILAIVITNLLANAAKYSPAESTVTARCSSRGSGLCIEIEDEGEGVPEMFARRIFEKGDRSGAGQASAGAPHGGFGLGLHIARTLCDVIGARLSVEPAANSSGSRFVIELPAAVRPAAGVLVGIEMRSGQ